MAQSEVLKIGLNLLKGEVMKILTILLLVVVFKSTHSYAMKIDIEKPIYFQFGNQEKTLNSSTLPMYDLTVLRTLFGDQQNAIKIYQDFDYMTLTSNDVLIATADKETTLKPVKGRFYTLAQVWLADNGDYAKYLKATDSLREKMGAKVLFKLKVDRNKDEGPDFIILVEWQNSEDIALYVRQDDFINSQHLFNKGTKKFNWYQVGF